MPAPNTHTFVHLEVSSASVLNDSVNGPINYLIGRDIGSDDAIQIEDSMEVLSGSGGHFLRLPQGTTGQRPAGVEGLIRFNSNDNVIDFHDGTNWSQVLAASLITFETLDAAGDIGNGSAQVSRGTHTHNLGAFTRVLFNQTIAASSISSNHTWQTFATKAVAQGNNLVLAGYLLISAASPSLSVRVRVAGATVAGSAINRGAFPSGLSSPTGMAPFANLLCIADNNSDELWTLDDITDPGSAINRGAFPSGLSSPTGMAPFANLLCIADNGGDELWTLDDITDPGSAINRGAFPSGLGSPGGMAPFANLLCIADNGIDELWTLDDITDPGSAINRGAFPSGVSSPTGMAPFANLLCIADNNSDELWTLDDITDPGSAINRGAFPSGLGSPTGMAPFANLLCIADTVGDELWTLDDILPFGAQSLDNGANSITLEAYKASGVSGDITVAFHGILLPYTAAG